MKMYKAAQLGSYADQVLKQYKHYSVSGVTSRGIFIAPPEKWVLFLSREPFRGPLTINLPAELQQNHQIQTGDGLMKQEGQLRFRHSNLVIDLSVAPIWSQSPPVLTSALILQKHIRTALQQIEDPFLNLLSGMMNRSEVRMSPIEKRILAFEIANSEEIDALLGLGAGLTPEGDDFLLGLGYLLKISQKTDNLNTAISDWLEHLAASAYQRTTTLSANLITCAAAGAVDERISDFMIGLNNGNETNTALKALLGWGATSGRMVLAGIITGIELVAQSDRFPGSK